MKRAVITGLGIVSSIGNNQQEVLASLREGRSGITFSQELRICSTALPIQCAEVAHAELME